MDELFCGNLSPTTETIGFLRCNAKTAANAFLSWQTGIHLQRGVSLEQTRVYGGIKSAILNLQPLTSVETRRYLFAPTSSDWVAYFDNGYRGTDAFPPISYLAQILSCDGVRATYVPAGNSARYPATIMEIYGPDDTDFLNIVRSISSGFDGSKWEFAANGNIQPFEDTNLYKRRSIKERFTGNTLDHYLKALGISAFDENFYAPDASEVILIEKQGPLAPLTREFRLPLS